MKYIFAGSVPSDIHCAKEFVNLATRSLHSLIYDEEVSFDIKLIIQELLMNGVVHGNGLNRDKYVSLGIDYSSHCLRIQVQDEGPGIDVEEDCGTNMKCNGRGLQIVRALSDGVQLNGNEIIVIKTI